MASKTRVPVDFFLIAILISAMLGALIPVRGWGADTAAWSVRGAIFVLFFCYGARLRPAEALTGLRHWKLHLIILGFTYALFPLIGLGLQHVLSPWLSPGLVIGVCYLTLVPSTVQSSVTFTSIARGNVAGAVVSASISNLMGVVLTPILTMAVLATSNQVQIESSSIIEIMVQLLLPFVLGQLSRPWTAAWVGSNHYWLKYVDQFSIVLVVYSAFAAGTRQHAWGLVNLNQMVVIVVICCVVLAVMLSLSWHSARWLGFSREDQIAIQFCGTKKSLATGLPMATVLFATLPVPLIVLPLMIFHMLQLIACSWLASRYGTKALDDLAPAQG